MSTNESLKRNTFVRIHHQPNGQVLGAVLWFPSWFIEMNIEPGQEEIEVFFEGNFIRTVLKKIADVLYDSRFPEHETGATGALSMEAP